MSASYEDGGKKVEGKISGSTSKDEQRMMSTSSSGSFDFDANDFVLDTAGSTVTLPGSGMFTLDLYSEGTSDNPRVSGRFAWVRSGEIIFVSNPQAVNDWLNQYGLSSDTLEYRLDPISDAGDSGAETLSVSTIYENEVQASSVTTYNMGSGCGPMGTYCDPQ